MELLPELGSGGLRDGRARLQRHGTSLRALPPAGFATSGAEVLPGPDRDFLRRSPTGVVAPA